MTGTSRNAPARNSTDSASDTSRSIDGWGPCSGGEVISLGLAAELLKRPDVLLLDEPTNNLDADARARLYNALDDYKGSLLLVSHDRMLLDRMDRIAELREGEISFYGGNFTDYEESVREASGLPRATCAPPNNR